MGDPGSNHRELLYGVLGAAPNADQLSEVIEGHVARAEMTDEALSDFMITVERLATTCYHLGAELERASRGEFNYRDSVRRKALEELNGGQAKG